MKVSGFLLLVIISLFSLSFASQHQGYEHLYFQSDKNSTYVSFGFYMDSFTSNTKFHIQIENEQGDIQNSCVVDLPSQGGIYYWKYLCLLPTLEEGKYTIISFIESNGEVSQKKRFSYVKTANNAGYYTFKEVGDGTLVTIHLLKSETPSRVYSQIPKEVIELLTPENKDSLIDSPLPYIIVEEDPLIAWDFDETPDQVNYTIKQKLTQAQKEKFEIKIESKQSSPILNYGALFLIIIVLIIIFKPLFKKKNE
jgi:hypothetical protein